jgi:hypothetical protein
MLIPPLIYTFISMQEKSITKKSKKSNNNSNEKCKISYVISILFISLKCKAESTPPAGRGQQTWATNNAGLWRWEKLKNVAKKLHLIAISIMTTTTGPSLASTAPQYMYNPKKSFTIHAKVSKINESN